MDKLKKPKGMFYCASGHQSDGSDLTWSEEKGIWTCPICEKSIRMLCHMSRNILQRLPACCPIT